MKKTVKVLMLLAALSLIAATFCSCAVETDRSEIVDIVKKLEAGQIAVSFEGLGIRPFVINKVAFTVPIGQNQFTVYWGGIVFLLAFVIAILYAVFRSKKNESIKGEDLFDICGWGIVAAVIGSRLIYVLTSLDKIKSFSEALMLWDGGASLFGAMMFGGATVYLICKLKKLKFLKVADLAASSLMLGQIVGRFTDFLNGSSYGYELGREELLYFARMGIAPHTAEGIGASSSMLAYVHPAFLYEITWNIVGFAIINVLYHKKKFNGQIFYAYMAWYGFGRMFIEMIRTDSLYVGSIRISMVLACLMFVAGVALLIVGAERGKKERLAGESYEKVYTNFNTGNPISSKYNEDPEEKENEDEDN